MDVIKYAIRKLVGGIPLILGVTFVSFLLMVYFGPDMTFEMLGKNPTPEQIAEFRELFGLDDPILVQYGRYVWNAIHGDLGQETETGKSRAEVIQQESEPQRLQLGNGAVNALQIPHKCPLEDFHFDLMGKFPQGGSQPVEHKHIV